MYVLMLQVATPLEWTSHWIANLGWPTLLGLAVLALWKGRGRMDAFLAAVKVSDTRLAETQATAAKVLSQVQTLQDNHMAHLEGKVDTMTSAQIESNRLLSNMDKALGILVDRSARV